MTRDATPTTGRDDWDEHWGAYATTNAQNPAQAYRRKLVFELLALETAKRPVRLMDLGSGSGEFAAEVLRVRPDAEIVGLDLAPSGVEMARRKVPKGRFFPQDFTQAMTLPAEYRGWATHAVCSEVLEHLDAPVSMLRNVRPYFAPGCRLVVTVPGGPMSAFDEAIGHRGHFTASRLETTMKDAGMEVAELLRAGFPFFNLYRLAVVARGKRVLEDARAEAGAELPASVRAAMRVFSVLFAMNATRSRLGWQLVASAREPCAG